jgi:hypothetical protein
MNMSSKKSKKAASPKPETASNSDKSASNEELIARIAKLEAENELLKNERESNKLKFFVDINDNLRKLQENLRDRFEHINLKDRLEHYSGSLSELKIPHVPKIDIRPWVAAVAEAHGTDVDVIANAVSVKKRQLLAVGVTFVLLPTSMLLTLLWLYIAIFHDVLHFFKTLLVLYAMHIYFDKTYENGNLLQWSWKKHWWWKMVRNYFPILLVKQNTETVYDPKKVYMFGYHPHGIISVGCFISFAADATGVSKLFPGITIFPATLTANFNIPFWRELLLRLGVIGVSAKCLHNVLDKGPGSAALVVPVSELVVALLRLTVHH